MKTIILGLFMLAPLSAMASQYECYYDYNHEEAPAVSVRHINLITTKDEVVLVVKYDDGQSETAVAQKTTNPNLFKVSNHQLMLTHNTTLFLRNIVIKSSKKESNSLTGEGSNLESNLYNCKKTDL